MQLQHPTQQLPLYSIEPDSITGSRHFRLYNFTGTLPNHADLLIPHRKDHYLLVFIRRGGHRQWVDMAPYVLKDNTVYFTIPNQIIVKEGTEKLWSTGIAFTSEFLSYQEGASISKLPMIHDMRGALEILLADADIAFVEDILTRISEEYHRPSEWQQRMLTAYLTVLLTYLSRLYTAQFQDNGIIAERQLLKDFHAAVNQHFREYHEVGDYAPLFHISAKHLSEVVKLQSGKPAIKHIHDRLVLEAKRMLVHTAQALKEIAYDLGFAEASYFNRFFKRETGMTPAEYRNSVRKMYH